MLRIQPRCWGRFQPSSQLQKKAVLFSSASGDSFTLSVERFLNWNEKIQYHYQGLRGIESYTIERAGPVNFKKGDDKRVIQLIQRVDGKHVDHLKDIHQRESSYFSPHNYYLLVRDNQNKIIGSGYLTSMANRYPALVDTALLGYLYVHPDHQGKGIASKLTDMRIAAAKQLGYRYLVLFTNNPKIDGTGERLGIATQRGFQYLGYSRRYRCYALSLETSGPIPNHRREQFKEAFNLQ